MKSNNKGFSLVELMVVVAIIGLLAAIAVPQFEKFQAKARQTEAKANSSAMFSAEQAFFVEWNGYASSWAATGFSLTGTLRYNIGYETGADFCPSSYNVAVTFAGPGCKVPTPVNAAEAGNVAYNEPNGLGLDSKNAYAALIMGDLAHAAKVGTNTSTAQFNFTLVGGVDGGMPEAIPTGAGYDVTQSTFVSAAIAIISKNGGIDMWTIDQNKTLKLVSNGL